MKSISKIIIISLFGLIPSIVAAQENEFLLGKADFDKKDYLQASVHLTVYLNTYPKNYKARLLRIQSNLYLANYSKVVDDLSEMKHTKNDEILLVQARALAGLGDNKQAIEKLNQYRITNNKIAEEIIIVYPEFAGLKNTVEWTDLWKNWKYTEKEIALIDVKYALKSERNDEAIDRLDQYLLKYKNNAEAYYLRGNLYNEKKDYKNALILYENAVSIENTNLDYLLARASANHKLKKDKKAIEEYNELLNNDSLLIEAYLGRSEVLLALSDYQLAFNDISKFRHYYPDHSGALFIEAQINVKLGDFLSAIGEFGRLIKANPGKPEYFIGRADSYSETKTYSYAIKDYSMALDLDPKNIEVYKKMAKAYQLSGDLKNACKEWEHAVQLGDVESMNYIQKHCKN